MLFSRIFALLKRRKINIEIKAAGIEAAIVRAIFNPTKVLEAAKTTAKKIPRTNARGVISGSDLDAGIKGTTSSLGSADDIFLPLSSLTIYTSEKHSTKQTNN